MLFSPFDRIVIVSKSHGRPSYIAPGHGHTTTWYILRQVRITPATVPCNQYNLFPCGRMGLDSLGRPLIYEFARSLHKASWAGEAHCLG